MMTNTIIVAWVMPRLKAMMMLRVRIRIRLPWQSVENA
jgi:hypothetical protein